MSTPNRNSLELPVQVGEPQKANLSRSSSSRYQVDRGEGQNDESLPAEEAPHTPVGALSTPLNQQQSNGRFEVEGGRRGSDEAAGDLLQTQKSVHFSVGDGTVSDNDQTTNRNSTAGYNTQNVKSFR